MTDDRHDVVFGSEVSAPADERLRELLFIDEHERVAPGRVGVEENWRELRAVEEQLESIGEAFGARTCCGSALASTWTRRSPTP